MRTNEPRVIPSIRLLGWLSAAGVIGVALAACSSSTHLDPPGGTGGRAASTTTSAGVGGDGGVPPTTCRSNPDCTTFPQSICDTIKGECQECLVDSDCTQKGGPVCASGKCGCPIKGEAFCATAGGGHCVDPTTSQSDCGSCGHACFGACSTGKCADPWEPTALVGAPEARTRHVAVWNATDKTMIVWGGYTVNGATSTGGIYNPATNTWTATSTANAPSARVDATALWDDTEKAMLVWGGRTALNGSTALGSGALYYPAKNVWKTIAVDANTPTARWGHTAVWTGTKMIIWGGANATGLIGDGASYDPVAGSWTLISPSPTPTARYDHTAVWTGDVTKTMLVWGGYGFDSMALPDYLADGAIYDLGSSTWAGLGTAGNPPTRRSQASAVWTGMNMLVWGGVDSTGYLGDGAKYASGTWFPISNLAPAPRAGHSAAWLSTTLGNRMIVWGGVNASGYLNSGALLDEVLLSWSSALPTAPTARAHHSTVINGTGGSKMIIWGGDVSGGTGLTDSGAIFDASAM
jgi:hypothetical protein